MSGPHLKSLAERIERLMDERDGIQSDIRDIYAEAKSHGFVPKVLRKAITRKRMDASKRDEEDAILELYEDALGPVGKAVAAVRAGATWKEAGEEHNVPRATLARAVRSQKRQTDTDGETGSATTVATGTLDALSPDNVPARQDACTTDAATTQDAAGRTEPRAIPDFLRRKTGEGNGVPSAARPDLDERAERAAQ